MTTIEIKNLTFGFDVQTTNLFEQTNLTIQSEWKLGLIGRNGRGKTTLLKLLMGEYTYSGKIEHQLNFTYFPQKVQDKTQLTYYVLQELSDFEQWKIERELNLLQVDSDILWRPFHSLSGGEQTKVLLALLFVDDVNYPLIDEPTNHLDVMARQQVAAYLKAKKQGFIVVSHDRSFVDEVVDHVLSIEKSQLVLYQGDFSVYEEQKGLRDQFEQEQNVKLKKEIGRLKQTAAEKAEWSRGRERDKLGSPNKPGSGAIYDTGAIGARAARTMKRSKAIVKRMEDQATEKEKLLKDMEYIEPLSMNYQVTHRKKLLTVQELQLSYGERKLFSPLTFDINQGDRLAIQGPNGSGKSSVIQHLLGIFQGEVTGEVIQPQGVTISYVRQNYEDNRGTLQEFAEEHHLSYQELLNNLWKLGVERKVFQNRIEEMSMGQRKRVELAKSLATPAELFIWDEPLNYLDVFNHKQLEEVIQLVQPTMLIVEHDRTFLNKVATKIIPL
ncbi:TPA: ABC-F type ribosomal protection protein [Enterococcus faecium]|uniref:ribosomal protection-like ABC-F family protein n=1 Tax=Enterococcaceae TaxID=81852 RepID=UPI000541C6F7|nr:ABC-F type ribosomal protection protein [Melissococcus sp. OM08-11BH]KHD42666.1 multidrug ABC transporter ATP-binding protein [Streptococcus uberis]HDL2512186.1 ABC-F type ribosomal protection protein [Enterococcus faecium]HEM3690553.1 ABC-F type ribosomal protection protein [Streptococcus suis]RGI28269.1 ABC-F type ribosomal protection protein [Melissococcus sp. OM08-11BH]HDL2512424.1 ABC-F type ribosomal protection protein [Enterococcus faecium]